MRRTALFQDAMPADRALYCAALVRADLMMNAVRVPLHGRNALARAQLAVTLDIHGRLDLIRLHAAHLPPAMRDAVEQYAGAMAAEFGLV